MKRKITLDKETIDRMKLAKSKGMTYNSFIVYLMDYMLKFSDKIKISGEVAQRLNDIKKENGYHTIDETISEMIKELEKYVGYDDEDDQDEM